MPTERCSPSRAAPMHIMATKRVAASIASSTMLLATAPSRPTPHLRPYMTPPRVEERHYQRLLWQAAKIADDITHYIQKNM
eukprot:6003360-Amphidinium_carterae.1